MFTVKEYITVTTLEEAYTLLQKNKNNKIIGGGMWLRMGTKNINMAIDLSALGLDTIEESDEYITLGAMTTLRMLECNPLLTEYFGELFSECVKPIVGVQFRNTATLGGSIHSRFGFSDLLTAFLAVETEVELYNGGRMPLEQFIDAGYEKDIVVRLWVKKANYSTCYLSQRKSATDLPVLTVAASKGENGVRIVVGARPSRARLCTQAMAEVQNDLTKETIQKAAETAVQELTFASNMRASKTYREMIAKVLVERALERIQ